MNDINKYYENILNEVEKLIKENKYLEAIDLLEDELEAPYMPLDFIPKFEEKLIECQYEYNYNNPSNNFSKLTKDELKEMIRKNNESSNMAIYNFFDKFINDFSKADENFFLEILKDGKYPNDIKFNILTSLKINQINLDVEFFNSFTKKSYKLNSLEYKDIEEYPFFMEVKKEIEDQTAKEPWMLDLCYVSIFQYFISYYPEFQLEDTDPKKFTLILMNVIKSSMEGTQIHDDKISNDIFSAIKGEESKNN